MSTPASAPIASTLASSNPRAAPSSSFAISLSPIPVSPNIPASPSSPATVTKRSPDANPEISDTFKNEVSSLCGKLRTASFSRRGPRLASRSELPLCAALFLLACPAPIFADKLQITSNPSGATVELDGVAVVTTPFEKDFPGGYFHKTRTSIGSRLEHPIVARISFIGYATRELKLTEGPMNWISLNGRNRGEYWLLKSDHFHVDLQPISETFTGGITAKVSDPPVGLQPELPLDHLVRQAKPALPYLTC